MDFTLRDDLFTTESPVGVSVIPRGSCIWISAWERLRKYGENSSTLGASFQPAPDLFHCDLIEPVSKVNEDRDDRANDTDWSGLIWEALTGEQSCS